GSRLVGDRIVAPTDPSPPPPPSTPILPTRLGTVQVAWDGETDPGTGMPLDFSHVEVHVSSAGGFTPTPATLWDTLTGTVSLTVITDLPYNTDVFVALVAVDRAGNKSDPSEESSIQVKPLVDTDLIGEIIDGANIIDGTLVASEKIVGESITGNLIQALSIEAGHIKSNAITADKIEAGAITAEKLSLGSVTPKHLTGAGVNHVTDPGFEDATYWAAVINGETAIEPPQGTWETSSATARSGGLSMRTTLSTLSEHNLNLMSATPVPPSRRVYVSGWARVGGGSTTPPIDTQIEMIVRIQYSDGAWAGYTLIMNPALSTSWTFSEWTLNLPQDVVVYRAYLRVQGHSSTGGAVYFDDITVQDVVGQDRGDRVEISPTGMKLYASDDERIRIDA